MFKVSYFLEVLPIIASKVNITFELTVAATIFALIVGVIIAIIGYYKIPVLYQLTRVYVSIMRGTPVVAQLYFFYYGIALYSAFVRNMTPLIAVAVVMSFNMGAFMSESIRGALLSVDEGQKEAAYSLGMTNFQLVTRIVIPQAVRVALPPLFNDIINLIKMTSLANPISCVTRIIVVPSSARDLIVFSTSPTSSGSNADVGSSNNTTFGFTASALAIPTLCCCPPDSFDG